MFCRSPKAANEQITDEPPELSRGSGRPVTGTMRMFMPILTNTWKNIIITTSDRGSNSNSNDCSVQ